MALTTVPGQLLSSTGDFTFANANITTTLVHHGLTFTDGQNIDQLTTVTSSLLLTHEWSDTGIHSNMLSNGTYALQLYANDVAAGGTNVNEYYSGMLSWYAGTTNSPEALPTDEIVLHRAGGSVEGGLYLRTYRSPNTEPLALRLQIYSNYASVSSSNYVFKFRRMI